MDIRSILALALSLGLSLLVTWAGLHYDNGLVYVGVALIALVFILFLWGWAFPKPAPIQYTQAPSEPEPKDEKERVLQSLKKARDNAAVAISQGNNSTRGRAYHEIVAVMLSIKKHYGIGPLQVTSETHASVPYKLVLEAYVAFIDRLYPLLREGHIDQAQAMKFNVAWGQD